MKEGDRRRGDGRDGAGERHAGTWKQRQNPERDLLVPALRSHSPFCPYGSRRVVPTRWDCAPGTSGKDWTGTCGQRNPGVCLQGEEGGGQGGGALKGTRRHTVQEEETQARRRHWKERADSAWQDRVPLPLLADRRLAKETLWASV